MKKKRVFQLLLLSGRKKNKKKAVVASKQPLILLDLSKLSDAGLIKQLSQVCNHLTSNSQYPSPPFSAEEMKACMNMYEEVLRNQPLNRINKSDYYAVLQRSRAKARTQLRSLAHYCMHVSTHNEKALAEAGFIMREPIPNEQPLYMATVRANKVKPAVSFNTGIASFLAMTIKRAVMNFFMM